MTRNILLLCLVLALELLVARSITETEAPLQRVTVSAPEAPLMSFREKCSSPKAPKNLDKWVRAAGMHYGVDPRSIANIIILESGCDPTLTGKDGDIGLGQIIGRIWYPTLRANKIQGDLYDPRSNINAVAFILSRLTAKFDKETAISRYNGRGQKARAYLIKFRRLYKSNGFGEF